MLCPYIPSRGPVDSRQGNVRGLIKIDSAVTGKMIWGRITLTLTIDGRREVRVEDGKRRAVVVDIDLREPGVQQLGRVHCSGCSKARSENGNGFGEPPHRPHALPP